MTAFASRDGQGQGFVWSWDLRGVNGKGLDLRLRLPDWIAGLEQAARGAVQGRLGRGNLTLNLRIARQPEAQAAAHLDMAALDATLDLVAQVEERARARGVTLRPPTALEILASRGAGDAPAPEPDLAALRATLMADLDALLGAFCAMRAEEGAALDAILRGQLDQIVTLLDQAEAAAEDRRAQMAEALRANLARVLDNADGADPDRVAQELALIAVKSDVREELDRLAAHVEAARTLLQAEDPVGRKFDFLMQEFNREANTLCSKAQSGPLTRIGLDLKSVIDQMREQVQNVE
ncbi:YicC/YloC family endoribonuclease [Rhodovulum adriaticum]|nr:YicC/YloC family endoribonuclease [Rhodovulum adriaticum]